MKNTFIYLLLIIPSLLISSCTPEDEKQVLTVTTYSEKISDSNVNMPSGGTITSQYSDSPKGETAVNLFDSDVQTKFSTSNKKVWLIWKSDKSILVNQYSLTSANDSPEKDPKYWTLSGSNDSILWVVLDHRFNQSFSKRSEKNEFGFYNTTSFKYFKLYITVNNGDAMTQLAEWSMGFGPINIDQLMSLSTGDSYTSSTPMGIHYKNRHRTTDSDRDWLKTAANEPDIPASAPTLHMVNFNVLLYPYGNPSPADINQKALGDCGGVAALASMAYIYPNFIKSIIKDNKDKTYTVSMFDPQGLPVMVTVSSKFLAGSDGKIAAVAGKNDKATWSTILEKAIMKYNVIYQCNPDIGGIGSQTVTPLFTGNGSSIAFDSDVLTNDQLEQVVKVSLAKGKFVIGGFSKVVKIGIFKTVTYHAFTFMFSTDPLALFAMRNPWGFCDGSPDGKEDGIMVIPNDNIVPRLIDLRIIDPGIAGTIGTNTPYSPPSFVPNANNVRIDPRLRISGE